ncbi:hypothetical protein KR054_009999 [Drosophila jambulina]|nr:hypothetical protein KR054_009999 [Drosophila jambulina]
MNQKRLNQMRSMNRGQEQGLQQILQPSAAGQLPAGNGIQGGNQAQQNLRRKMTYTRTELLCRGLPTTQNPRRSPRNRGTYSQPPAVPQTPLSAGHGNATSMTLPPRQRSFLPRASRLHSPNRNLTRMRTDMELKAEQSHIKKTPRVPSTPHGSHCSIPYPIGAGAGHRSGIPVLDRSRIRECGHKQRDTKDLTDTSSRSSSPATERAKIRMGKPIPLPADPQNKSFVYLCKPVKKVKELLTARQLRHSCENLELEGFGKDKGGKKSNLQKTNSEELLHSKANEQGLELSSITEMSLTPTSSIVSQVQLPQKQKEEEYLSQKEQRQKEMDMVCQNLPTLQHEIRLLQELNEKLESTLRGSNAARHYTMERQSSTAFYTPRCGPMLFMELPLGRVSFLRVEQLARVTQRVQVLAFAHNLAVVREFRIETKTLDELKASDETQCFYLPQPKGEQEQQTQTLKESNPPPLQCTNLRMLRENPSVLIQQLRRGVNGGNGSYNLLDHDMFMFINSLTNKSEEGFLYSSLAVGIPSKDNAGQEYHQEKQQLQLQEKMVSQQVNSTTQTEEEREQVEQQGKEQKQEQEQQEQAQDLDASQSKPKNKLKKPKQPQQVIRKARILKRSPIQSNVEPKVRMKLFKTVLVGLVQVAVFLVLIMAFMYPDASC